MKVHIPGFSALNGSPITILRLMRDARFCHDAPDLDEYIVEMQQAAWRIYNVGLCVTGDTIEERAESLLREMDRHHLLEIEEEHVSQK